VWIASCEGPEAHEYLRGLDWFVALSAQWPTRMWGNCVDVPLE